MLEKHIKMLTKDSIGILILEIQLYSPSLKF